MKAPIDLFERNKSGDIMTRFTKDQQVVDTLVFPSISAVLNGLMKLIVVIITVSIGSPYHLITFAIALLILYWFYHGAVYLLQQS